MINKTFLAAVALVSVVAATNAAAEPFAFRYKTYELETKGGRADLMARLDRSVDRYCATKGVRNISARRTAEECRQETMAEVLAKIDNVEFASLEK